MRTDRVSAIIQRIYAKKYNLVPAREIAPRTGRYMAVIQPVFGAIKQKRFQILVFILLLAIAAGSIYYYNLLVSTEQDVLASRGKVYALEQRRNDISINLSKAVFDYSRHERSVFTAVVALRSFLSKEDLKNPEIEKFIQEFNPPDFPLTGMGEGKLGGILSASALDRLLAIAEQYPDLKLASNFESLMAALVEVEKDLATERIKFNDAVNTYTTNIAKFPINVYAMLFGFEKVPYFEATEDARQFRPIDY